MPLAGWRECEYIPTVFTLTIWAGHTSSGMGVSLKCTPASFIVTSAQGPVVAIANRGEISSVSTFSTPPADKPSSPSMVRSAYCILNTSATRLHKSLVSSGGRIARIYRPIEHIAAIHPVHRLIPELIPAAIPYCEIVPSDLLNVSFRQVS